jgi:RHS repeat-associated protein
MKFSCSENRLDADLDALGNWDSVTNDGGSPITRTFDKQNRITTSGFTHSANGEMRSDASGQTYVYDAWGMIVSVDPDGTGTTSPTTTYTYDALHRRISTDADGTGSGVATYHYFSKDWQVLEDRVGSIVKHAYVMSPVFVDAMVLRDSDTDGSNSTGEYGYPSTSKFEQRVYVLNDANFNVTALVGDTDTGTPRNFQVIERFRADAYGAPTFLDPNWAVDTGGSDFGWMHLHQGGRYDAATKLAHFRWRDLHVDLGRWTRQDPIAYADGHNLYAFVVSSPVNLIDPMGTRPTYLGKEDLPQGWRPPPSPTGPPFYDPKVDESYTPPAWEDKAQRVLTVSGIVLVTGGVGILYAGGTAAQLTGAGIWLGGGTGGYVVGEYWNELFN